MSYIVLGLGILLSAIGAYAMYSGFRIVEIERGWTTAIVGAVLFTGGVVTLALGLLARTLERFRVRWETQLASTRYDEPTAEPALSTPIAAAEPAPFEVASTFSWDDPPSPEVAKPENRCGLLNGEHDETTTPEAEPATIATLFADEARDEPAKRTQRDESSANTTAAAQEPETSSETASPPAPPSEPAAMDDWLDQSFAEFDEPRGPDHGTPDAQAEERVTPAVEAAGSQGAKHREREAQEVRDAEQQPVHAEEKPVEVIVPQPAAGSLEEPATSAVIGRYESEGTSYVMYADGSIEAQSEAGVYRFASMAELKAFIEG